MDSPMTATAAQSRIDAALDNQESLIGNLSERLHRLESRLIPVLGPVPPQSNEAAKLAERPTRLVEKIDLASRDLERFIGFVSQLIERLEL